MATESDRAQMCAYSDFSERMGLLVESCGGPTALARKSGLSRRVIDKYRSGASDPSRERLVAMAKAADISIVWLATGEGPMRPDEGTPHHEAGGELPFDDELLATAIKVLEEWLAERRASLSPERKAQTVIALYEIGLTNRENGGGARPK